MKLNADQVKVTVFRHLSAAPATARELAKSTGLPVTTVQTALKTLYRAGLIRRDKWQRSHTYRRLAAHSEGSGQIAGPTFARGLANWR